MTWRRAVWLLIGVSTALRLAWASSLGAYTNESYYFVYASHLDWSYFDHPPMVGLVAASGLRLLGDRWPELGLRLGFIALFAGSSWLLARLTARLFGPGAGFLAVLGLNATIFFGVMIGTFAEPDGPLLFFWLLTLDRLWVALESPHRGSSLWAMVGLAWGAALLSKYHAVLIPAGVCLHLLVTPSARRCLRTPGPYLAALLGLLMFTPVVFWNATHGWASFLYQGNRAGGFQGLKLEMLFEALLAQFIYLTPWIWIWLVAILVRLVRRGPRSWTPAESFLACQALPAIGLFMGVATFRRIMPHWPLIGFVSLLPMLGRSWAERLADRPRGSGLRLACLAAGPVILGSLFVVQARTGLFQDGRGRLFGLVPASADPTVETIRWDQTALELKRRGLLDDPGVFLFTGSWLSSAGLAMATRDAVPVACFHRDARSYTFWSRPEEWVGRDAIFVRPSDGLVDPEVYAPWFRRIEPLGTFPIVRAGVPLQEVRLYRCVGMRAPFPFGYAGPGPIPLPPGLDGSRPEDDRSLAQDRRRSRDRGTR